MELSLTFALLIPLIASVLTTINANYKNVGLAIATGVVGAVASGTIGLLNGIKNNFKFLQRAQFYHDRAIKMAEIQDTISVAINLRMFDSSEYFEQSAKYELMSGLPLGSDITGTSNLTKVDKITEGNVSLRGTPLKHLPPALEKQILATHASTTTPNSSEHRASSFYGKVQERRTHHRESGGASPAPSVASVASVASFASMDSGLSSRSRGSRYGTQDR